MNRALKASLVSLWRNKVTSLGVIVVIAILIFILNVILTVHFTAKTELKRLAKKIDLVVYLENSIQKEKGEEIANYIKGLPGVEKTSFISKEEALDQFLKAHPKTAEYYKKFNLENTLPASIRIMVQSPEWYEKTEQTLEKSRYAGLLKNIGDEKKDLTLTGNIVHNLEDLTNFTKYLLYWVIIAFAIGALLLVSNAIHLNIYSRKTEISILRLVGGGQKFIVAPYLLEALWISLIALIASFLLFWILGQTTIVRELALFGKMTEIPYWKIFLIEGVAVTSLNGIGSFFTVQKYIKHSGA